MAFPATRAWSYTDQSRCLAALKYVLCIMCMNSWLRKVWLISQKYSHNDVEIRADGTVVGVVLGGSRFGVIDGGTCWDCEGALIDVGAVTKLEDGAFISMEAVEPLLTSWFMFMSKTVSKTYQNKSTLLWKKTWKWHGNGNLVSQCFYAQLS